MNKYLLALFVLLLGSCTKVHNITNSDNIVVHKQQLNTINALTDLNFINEKIGIVSGEYGFLAKTTDGGNTWDSLNLGINAGILSTVMLNEQTFYCASEGIYKTTNSGKNFYEQGELSKLSGAIWGMHFFNTNSAVIIKSNLIMKTNDGGLTWETKYDSAEYIRKLQMTSNLVGYAAGGISFDQSSFGEIHKTIDGGNTWSKILNTNTEIMAFHFIDNTIGFYADYKKNVYKTSNGSVTWNKCSSIPNTPTSICFYDEKNGYLSTYQGEIFVTNDGALTWKRIYKNEEFHITKMIVKNRTVLAIGSNGFFLKITQ